MKSERQYYIELLRYSREHLMLFPYHLSDFIVSGMRITPFQYYISMVHEILDQEKSYDTLPNFTAADCVRLLGIGRNQYIDLMNQCRSRKFLGMIRKPIKDLLPSHPVKNIMIEYWWGVFPGYITEDDIKFMATSGEKEIIDKIVCDDVPLKTYPRAGDFDEKNIRSLYLKGLIYLDVPIQDNDLIVVPPLEGFVMNRVTGDYFETLLYKTFVSIDEKTSVAELASILQIDLSLVKNAISMYCRLGFAYKKNCEMTLDQCHPSWKEVPNSSNWSVIGRKMSVQVSAHQEWDKFITGLTDESESMHIESNDHSNSDHISAIAEHNESQKAASCALLTSSNSVSADQQRVALFYDSTLAAFLMMGNLSPGLKSHAVTMFEVGKLSDESLDTLLVELSKISNINIEEEGIEAERYFLHAIMLYRTITFLRNNSQLTGSFPGLGLDLVRCESLMNLDTKSCERLLHKNYKVLLSVAPLSNETKLINNPCLPYFGPASSLINSIWFKLYLYSSTGYGPPSLLLTRGKRLNILPDIFDDFDTLYLTPWARDSARIPIECALYSINEALTHSPLLVQGYSNAKSDSTDDDLIYVPFPLSSSPSSSSSCEQDGNETSKNPFEDHPAILELSKCLNLKTMCGFVTLIKPHSFWPSMKESDVQDFKEYDCWTLIDCNFGIPLFDRALNKSVCNKILKHQLFSNQV